LFVKKCELTIAGIAASWKNYIFKYDLRTN